MITNLEQALEQNKALVHETFRVTQLKLSLESELKIAKRENTFLKESFKGLTQQHANAVAKQSCATKTDEVEANLSNNLKVLSVYSMQLEEKNKMWRDASARVQQLEKDMVVVFENSQKSMQKSEGENYSEETKKRIDKFEGLIAAKDAALLKAKEDNSLLANAVLVLERDILEIKTELQKRTATAPVVILPPQMNANYPVQPDFTSQIMNRMLQMQAEIQRLQQQQGNV